LPAGL